MRLRAQLTFMVGVAVVGVVAGAIIVFLLADGVHDLHDRVVDVRTDLATQFELVVAVQSYFAEQRELFAGGEDDERTEAAHQSAKAAFARLLSANDDERAEASEIAESARLFDELVAKLVALRKQPANEAREEALEEVFEKRYERELLPGLRKVVEQEQQELSAGVAALDRQARTGRWVALLFGLFGTVSVVVIARLAIRQVESGVGALVGGARAIGAGSLSTVVPPLHIVELDEVGHALNQMTVRLTEATEAKTRVEKLAAVGQLAASVGHEVRNPLSAARNALAFLSRVIPATDPASNPRVHQFISLADRELAACNKIVEDLLDFARERPLNFTACPLGPLVAEVVEVVRRPDSTRLVVDIPEKSQPVDADRDQLRQLLGNLVQNAVEAVPGDREGEVTIKIVEADGMALIRVIDNGDGIPEGDRQRVFEPLVTTKSKGTGLGLAIVANIVKRHGGTIQITSEMGRGTTFEVALPLRQGSTT